MNENIFDKLDFGPFRELLDNDDITDVSYDNNGQIWIRSLTQGSMRVEIEGATPEFVEKLAFQCSNVMGTTFNNAKPFLDAESAELRMNFVHQSIATNGIALVIRKTPAKIRLEKDKLLKEDYFTADVHDLLINCVVGHCNIMVAGETGSGKTEFVKYLASHTKTNEKIITIEDTLELHLDKIFPQRDIVAMKTNNVASYSDVLVTCMRQNPKWILLSEVRSAEAVSAVRNSISSGHNILSTIHADKASAIPYRLYSLMETDLDVNQFLSTIYRYIQLGVHIKAFYSKEYGKFHRELDEVCEFYVDENNVPQARIIYQKLYGQTPMMCKPSAHLQEYLANQNIDISEIVSRLPDEMPFTEQELMDEFETEENNNNPKDANQVANNETDKDNAENEKNDNQSTETVNSDNSSQVNDTSNEEKVADTTNQNSDEKIENKEVNDNVNSTDANVAPVNQDNVVQTALPPQENSQAAATGDENKVEEVPQIPDKPKLAEAVVQPIKQQVPAAQTQVVQQPVAQPVANNVAPAQPVAPVQQVVAAQPVAPAQQVVATPQVQIPVAQQAQAVVQQPVATAVDAQVPKLAKLES